MSQSLEPVFNVVVAQSKLNPNAPVFVMPSLVGGMQGNQQQKETNYPNPNISEGQGESKRITRAMSVQLALTRKTSISQSLLSKTEETVSKVEQGISIATEEDLATSKVDQDKRGKKRSFDELKDQAPPLECLQNYTAHLTFKEHRKSDLIFSRRA